MKTGTCTSNIISTYTFLADAATIGHVVHGKSTVVMAITGVMTVRFKNELIRNITTELGYANAKMRQALPSPFIVLLPSTVAESFHFLHSSSTTSMR